MLSWFAFATADHPLGVRTAFEHTAALAEKAVGAAGVEQTNGYFAAKADGGQAAEDRLGVDARRSACSSGRSSVPGSPATAHRRPSRPCGGERFGGSAGVRLAAAFLAGAVMMFGARLAQGCTSGHGISGNLQLAASSLGVHRGLLRRRDRRPRFALYGRKGAEPCLTHPTSCCSAW